MVSARGEEVMVVVIITHCLLFCLYNFNKPDFVLIYL